MFDRPVVFVDIETTGASSHRSRIIEIALIRVEDGHIIDEYHSLINPGQYLPEWISSLTGIKNADLVGKPYFEDIADNVHRICKDAVFIAHNVRFDFSFIKRQLEGCGYSFNPDLLCTVRLSRALYPEQRSHKLESIISRHNISVPARHRAYEDTKALWDFCNIAYEEHGESIFSAAIKKQLKRRATPPNVQQEQIAKLPNTPGVYIFEDEDGKPLYVGKSIRIRQRVMSHFTEDINSEKEMKMSLNVYNIRHFETSNELEALLLESKLVKELLPLYNRKLRRIRKYVALLKNTNSEGYSTLSINDIDLSKCDLNSVYGIFETRGKAKSALLTYQKTYSICPKMLGLENGKGPCFQYHIKRCAGACIGAMEIASHNLRIELALERTKLASWPYEGAVRVTSDNEEEGIIVDNWLIRGRYVNGEIVEEANSSFDLDSYKILRAHLLNPLKNNLRLQPISI